MSAFAPLCPLFSSDDGDDDENSDETSAPPPPSPKFSKAMFFEMMEVFNVLKSSGAAIGPSVYKKYVNLIVIEAIPLLQAEPNILNLESRWVSHTQSCLHKFKPRFLSVQVPNRFRRYSRALFRPSTRI